MPPPLPTRKRNAIITDLQTGILSRNAIARKHKVAPSTVTALAKKHQIPNTFERSQTQNATRARAADNTARRAALIDRFYTVADHMLDRVTGPYEQVVSGPGGAELVVTDLPPLRDAQAGMSSAAIAVDKALRLEDRNGDGRVEDVKSMLGQVFDGFRRAHGDSADGSG